MDEEGNRTKIGEYLRNYSSFYNTFHPFVQNGKEYALYSKDYTATRVMELPSCQDIAGEDRNSFGFCPIDFYVPDEVEDSEDNKRLKGDFGFVSIK